MLAVLALGAIIALCVTGHRSAAAPAAKVSLAPASVTSVAPELAVVSKAALSPPVAAAQAVPRRLRAYWWAQKQAGHPYVWGGTGPGFDCSGLVMMAWRHAGVDLPRTTTEMLASPLLVRVWHPRMGDLAFYGTGHVELFRKWGWTFGAHDAGSVVGLIHYGWGWVPTAFYRVR